MNFKSESLRLWRKITYFCYRVRQRVFKIGGRFLKHDAVTKLKFAAYFIVYIVPIFVDLIASGGLESC